MTTIGPVSLSEVSPNARIDQDPFLIDSHKLQFHPKRVAQWLEAKTIEDKLEVFPLYVEISPVGHCNHRCTFCAVDYIGYKTRSIGLLVLIDALSDMARCGVKSVMFAGEGEPMLHPDIGHIVNHAHGVGLDVAFTTNGTALTKRFSDEALQSVKWIKVSINGGDAKTYAQIHRCREDAYERVWKNLSYASKVRSKETALGVQTVVLPDNIGTLSGLIARAASEGMDYVVLKPYSQHKSSTTTVYHGISYKDSAINQAIYQAAAEGVRRGIKVIARTQAMEDWDEGIHKYSTCHATPYLWAYIMATGDVYSCSAYLLDPEFCLGNVSSMDFASIWRGDRRREHLKKMESLDISKCRLNCRMNQVNKYLDQVKRGNPHASFI